MRADDLDFSTNSYRKAAYRQYILWRYGRLGKGNRRVCPSCVVRMIRVAYPSANGNSWVSEPVRSAIKVKPAIFFSALDS